MTHFRAETWIDLRKDRSISQLMLDNVSNTPDDKVIYEDTLYGKCATYGGFRQQVVQSAYWLRHTVGLKPGQTVTIISPSCVDYLVVAHSVWWAGGIVSTINSALNAREIAHGITVLEPDYLVVHSTVFEVVNLVLKSSTKNPFPMVLTLGHQHSDWPSFPTELKPRLASENLEPFSLTGRDSSKVCAAIVLSSGTTGSSKAVMLSHYNLVSTCEQLRADNVQNWRGSQREIFFPPLSHIYGLYVCATMCCWIGAYVCMLPRFDLELYCRLMHERKATLARLVPPVAKMLAEDPVVQKYTYQYLEYFSCSAAPLKAKLAHQLMARFPHVTLCQTYGCTELSGAIVQSGVRNKNMPVTATGTAIANIEMRFVDDNLEDAGLSGPGEIIVRGPNVMMGYKNNQAATSETMIEGGWFRTGDLGYMDEVGYVHIYDRLKDVIKYKGFQVPPAEIEEVLFQHPAVLDAAVVGIWSDEESTELPKAFIVCHKLMKSASEAAETATSIRDFVAEQVSSYKRLRGGVEFVDALPRNPTGKILRRILRDNMATAEGRIPSKL